MSMLVSYSDSSDSEPEIEAGPNVSPLDLVRDLISLTLLPAVIAKTEQNLRDIKERHRGNDNVIDISDSSEDEDDSATSDEEEEVYIKKEPLDKEDEGEEDSHKRRNHVPKSRHGLLDNVSLPPIEDLHISVPAYECTEVGTVAQTLDEVVVVAAKPGTPAVDEDTVLFLDQGSRPLGKVTSLTLVTCRKQSSTFIKCLKPLNHS